MTTEMRLTLNSLVYHQCNYDNSKIILRNENANSEIILPKTKPYDTLYDMMVDATVYELGNGSLHAYTDENGVVNYEQYTAGKVAFNSLYKLCGNQYKFNVLREFLFDVYKPNGNSKPLVS